MASQYRPNNVGILAIEIYFPSTYVNHSDLENFDGVSKGKYTIGLGQQSIAFTGDREDVNSIALTCVQSLLQKYAIHPNEVGRLEVGSETLVDKSKSTKTVLMRLFSPENIEMEGVSTLNACYGGTAAFFNAVDWIESSAWDGRFALVVMPEIAIYDKGPARPTSGCGAIAMLLGPNASIVLDSRTRTTCSGDIYDFYKPDPSTEYPVVDGSTSQTAYVKALDLCYSRFASKQSGSCVLSDFRNVVFHSPYNKLVQKAFARLFYLDFRRKADTLADHPLAPWKECSLEATYDDRVLDLNSRDLARELYNDMVAPSCTTSQRIGNTYTASLYINLATLVSSSYKSWNENASKSILMYSYGSGFIASMFQLRFASDRVANRFTLERMAMCLDLENRINARILKTPAEFERHLHLRMRFYGQKACSPVQTIDDLPDGTFYLDHIDSTHQRIYAQKGATVSSIKQPLIRHNLAYRSQVFVTGMGIKLPGVAISSPKEAFEALLQGVNRIECLSERSIDSMLTKNIHVMKKTSADRKMEPVRGREESVQVAARMTQSPGIDLVGSYKLDPAIVKTMDLGTRIAIAAGLDALNASNLVQGRECEDFRRWKLDDSIRDSFGVAYATSYPTMQATLEESAKYHASPATYQFDRKFLFRVLVQANAQLAQIIGARGPNTQINAACAGTTAAISMAQDWLRLGYCTRVLVVSSDVASSDVMLPWIGSGFRALGAASTASKVEEAALPFDVRRNGMVLGAGAVGLVLELEPLPSRRSVRLVASQVSNSAFHGASLDTEHITQELKRFLVHIDREFGISREELARNGVYYSHETFTNATSTTSCAFIEIQSLENALGDPNLLSELMISNTKGFLGHAMSVSFEDIAAVQGLKDQIVCPVVNFQTHDPKISKVPLKLSKGGHYSHRYALRFAAGFGSHIAFTLYQANEV
uniref:HydroxymethylglutarylCoA synthase putative n=1 Tax=Albugo laibachii Nc14 TaxID=890382 RepID=F0WUZ4_9STRA|nr:hydroxymethylglutarylCoA synthase putative [Albugo laibachii Nc14]|eukprot:CCA25230.1 hydroxymethylglutarylCoA synthase putative [Albugo laibachii Nc14]